MGLLTKSPTRTRNVDEDLHMTPLMRIPGFLPYGLMIFLNAFVDLGHKIVIQNTVFKTTDGDIQIILTAVVNALILLPYILLFSPSGYLSDRYSKHTVMRFSAWVAVGLTMLITLFYYLGWFWPAFAMTFLLAVQSAIYSPAKYGYIKELVGKERLAVGNGAVQALTTTAILAGIFAFSVLFEGYLDGTTYSNAGEVMRLVAPVGFFLVAGSLLELWLAYRLPQTREDDTDMRFDWAHYRRGGYLKDNLAGTFKRPVIHQSIIGLSIFWALSQVVLAVFPAFAKESLAIENTIVIQGAMACAGFGIILGSWIAGRVSRDYIETGLVPLGALGIAGSLFFIPVVDSVYIHIANFFFFGVMGGLFLVPLNALIQFHAGENAAGRILAANNFIQHSVMLGFLALTVLASVASIGSVAVITALGFIGVIGAAYTIYRLPQSLLRFLISRLVASRYRLEVVGLRNMPAQGGVLMLGNHISWLDWAMVQMASPRPVHFVMERSIYERWYLRWFLDLFGVIPISGGSSKAALSAISRLLNEGKVVCLFPEGSISRSGQLGSFKKGFERAAEEAEGVILPFYLRGLWGSVFSRASARLKKSRNTRDVIVAFGQPMPMQTKTAQAKQAVFELSVSSWEAHVEQMPTPAHAWLANAGRNGNDLAVTDPLTGSLSKRRFATATLLFSRRIARAEGQNIGLLLPASNAGAIANMATLVAGKTVVNLNYTSSPEAIRGGIEVAEIKSVFTSRRFLKKLEDKGFNLQAVLEGVQLHYLEDVKESIGKLESLSTLAMIGLLPSALLPVLFGRQQNPEDTAAILFSSGSEGTPKGIELTHRNLMANTRQVSDVLNMEDEDVIVANLPLFHAFGFTVTTLLPLLEGLTMVCQPDPTDALGTAKAVARHRATIMFGTSTFLRLYARNTRVHPLMMESLRVVVAGAERLNPEVRKAFTGKFNVPIVEGYGATETTPVVSVNLPDRLDTQFWQVQEGSRTGTVGMPLPGTSFRIVDPQTLESLPTGEDGMILIGGVQVMKGYLHDPDKTAEVVVELDGRRWYMTGDKGHLDQDGFLTIVDRYSRFAKLGGEMISLTQVEEQVRTVLQDPDLELIAVNAPDAKKGERIILLLADERDPESVRKALIDAGCNPLTIPAEVRPIDEVPKLGSGKTDFKAAKALVA